jgi:hypothetical protein
MATFSVQDSDAVTEMADRIQDAVRPIVDSMNGWQGVTQLYDRDGGKLVLIHYFDTRENLDAAEPTFEELPQRFDESLREQVRRVAGGRQSVERFEVTAEMRRSG